MMNEKIAKYCLRAMLCEVPCEECEIYGQCGTDHCEHDVIRYVLNELEELIRYRDNGWIPCVNELPQEYTDVLGCDYNGHIYVVQLYKDSIFGKIWRQWNGGMLRLDVIIAWQPLPEQYKPEGENNA